MPYSSNQDLPNNVKDILPNSAQTLWRRAFDSAFEESQSDETASKIAWGAVKNKYKKGPGDQWIKKGQIDAPNYKKSDDEDNCNNCTFSRNNNMCEKYDFQYKNGWICNTWEEKVNKFKADFEIMKADESLGIVFGWGMITKINGEPYYDLDNLHINDSLMVKATTDFMETSRVNNDSHTTIDIGEVIHSFPIDDDIKKAMGIDSNINGWMVGVKPDATTFQKYVSGEYTGFSIEGAGHIEDEKE